MSSGGTREKAAEIGGSAVAAELAADPEPSAAAPQLRLWLRMLACTNLVEAELRRRLRERFATTLPRFDLMAQLARVPDGIPLGELSRRMMVSNGNVTGLVERLVSEGLVDRRVSVEDRRFAHVRLTARGDRIFREMAEAHRGWVAELLAGLDLDDVQRLYADLDLVRHSVERGRDGAPG